MICLFDYDSLLYYSVYRIVSISDMKGLLSAQPELPYKDRKQKAFNYIIDESFVRMGEKTLKIFDSIESTGYNLTGFEYYITNCKNSVRKEISPYYKSNRKPNKYVSELRSMLIKEGSAIFNDKYEADDLIADRAKELRNLGKDYIVVSIDKDLKQIAGLHFDYYPIYAKNPETGEKIFVRLKGLSFTSAFESAEMLAMQMLMGDSGDRVKGLPSIGEKRAQKLLKDCQKPFSLFRKVVSEYIKRDGDFLGKVVNDDGIEEDVFFDWRIELMTNYRLIKLGKTLEL